MPKLQRRLHADFDAACQWIARETIGRGLILTRHPGEVFWQTGHLTIEPDSSSPDAIDRLIDRLGVTYLLIDDERYISAGSNPLKSMSGIIRAEQSLSGVKAMAECRFKFSRLYDRSRSVLTLARSSVNITTLIFSAVCTSFMAI